MGVRIRGAVLDAMFATWRVGAVKWSDQHTWVDVECAPSCVLFLPVARRREPNLLLKMAAPHHCVSTDCTVGVEIIGFKQE